MTLTMDGWSKRVKLDLLLMRLPRRQARKKTDSREGVQCIPRTFPWFLPTDGTIAPIRYAQRHLTTGLVQDQRSEDTCSCSFFPRLKSSGSRRRICPDSQSESDRERSGQAKLPLGAARLARSSLAVWSDRCFDRILVLHRGTSQENNTTSTYEAAAAVCLPALPCLWVWVSGGLPVCAVAARQACKTTPFCLAAWGRAGRDSDLRDAYSLLVPDAVSARRPTLRAPLPRYYASAAVVPVKHLPAVPWSSATVAAGKTLVSMGNPVRLSSLESCSVVNFFAKWPCSTFRCYLTISVQSLSN
jgi:hypothetical protein